jgi:hypothetical protein
MVDEFDVRDEEADVEVSAFVAGAGEGYIAEADGLRFFEWLWLGGVFGWARVVAFSFLERGVAGRMACFEDRT